MASNVTPFPRLPSPQGEIDSIYMTDLVRALETFISVVQNPGGSRATDLTLTALQSGNDVGLEVGALYELDGFVKITLVNVSACSGISATSGLGTVTVAVS
jgi:hypothetical protein|tara:strand:- start:217 stop:519 length:303 start_codon:yes stop_codon:yes gene_type:complete